ncbi:hypothetical protein BVC80_2955g1 [Macleaya cordata]|uniref:Reverse transcriptase zinc-binding domain n=1 Tax=Macleaya cordata TaxID=56857 RepID=A0A200R852_MACCD|nr:hypothetical protein BVC80_2955g1 [Macleaya cordata]
MPPPQKQFICNLFGMPECSFPDSYLGVPIFPGRVKKAQVWHVVDRLQETLAGWKGSLLSFQARLCLIKSVLFSIPIYNMAIYKWPKSVINSCERIMRNFLWSGDPAKSKLITKAWHKICCPKDEGGLGLVRLETLNRALLSKLMWGIYSSKNSWAKFLLAKFRYKKGGWITYYKQSSIWGGLQWAISSMEGNLGWIIGDGKSISIWLDTWCSLEPISNMVTIDGNLFDLGEKALILRICLPLPWETIT